MRAGTRCGCGAGVVALEVGPRREQPGERLAFHRHRPPRRDRVDHRPPEDVRARVDLVGDDLLRRLGLLQEGEHPARVVRGDQSVRPGVRHLREVQRDVRPRGPVRPHQRADVESREDVPVEDEDRFVRSRVQPGRDVPEGAARAERLLLRHVLDVQPQRRPVAEVRLEDLGQVGSGQDDVLDARRCGPRQLVREEGHAGRGDHGFRRVHRERSQSRAFAADQEDRFCHLSSLLPAGTGRTVFRPASVCRPSPGRRRRPAGLSGPGNGPPWSAWCRASCTAFPLGTRC